MKQIIKKPIISEKSYLLARENRYSFVVDKIATKAEIKEAIQSLFSIKVLSMNVMNVIGKTKRTKKGSGKRGDYKKVIIATDKKDKIDLFEIEEENKTKKEKKAK